MGRRNLQVVLNFAAKGPGHHWRYLRWKCSQLLQRIFSYSYRSANPTARSGYGKPRLANRATRFFFSDESIKEIAKEVPDGCRRETIRQANEVCSLEFSFRQSDPFTFESEIDWLYSPDGNKDWRWDLNRHAYFETLGFAFHYTGDEKYARAFVEIFESWLRNNPPRVDGPNWSSAFEVGFRINSWSWAFFLFKNSASISDASFAKLHRGIEAHCQFLAANIELHARNNHLLLEAKSLLLGAMLFPEFPNSEKWQKLSRKLLYDEIRTQVYDDGVHGEMSTHYHRVIAGELVELLILHEINNIAFPRDILDRLRKMVQYEADFTRPDLTMPLLGDSSQQDTYLRLSALQAGPCLFDLRDEDFERPQLNEAAIWRLAMISKTAGRARNSTGASSQAYTDGGCYLMRCGRTREDAMYLNIDCGSFGLRSDPHHGHADALSIDIFANGRSWIPDSGVYSTHSEWSWRQYFRGTHSHNTIVVDGLDQSVLLDSRRVQRTANATCRKWVTGPAIDFFEGSHDGYERLPEPVTHHRRIWFVRNSYWLILDSLTGSGKHVFETIHHFHENLNVRVEPDGSRAVIEDDDDRQMIVSTTASADLRAEVVIGRTDPVQGWRSENSGRKTPAPALIFRADTVAPLTICSVIVPSTTGQDKHHSLQLLCNDDHGNGTVSASVEWDDWTDYFFCSTDDQRERRDFGPFSSDAGVAFVRQVANNKDPAIGSCDEGSIYGKNGELVQPLSEELPG